ncbi:hypothetical protein FBU30_002472 [Linnemannia zychae]|nr:hypothetical protein FBU30_002472 [Linnemannia zychae]
MVLRSTRHNVPGVHTRYFNSNSLISSSSPTSLVALTVFLFALFALIPIVNAQSPISRRRLAYVQYDNQLYLEGGIAQAGVSNQFNSLDLSKSWSVTSPSWSMLAGGNWVSHHTMVAVKPEHGAGLGGGSKGYLLSIGGVPASNNGFWSAYDIQAGTWANLTTAAPYVGLEGQAAVADPSTGHVYIIGGYYSDAAANISVANRLTVYDPTSNSVVLQQAATDKNNLTGTAVIWSTKRNTILTFGGSRAVSSSAVSGLAVGNIDEYDPASKIWKIMSTTGNIPTRVLDACVAASEDGSKIVLFGGSLDSNTFFSTIYILDVISGVWSLGQAAPEYRARMACGFHAGQFIAFGGSRDTNQKTGMHSNLPIIYDVNANTWLSDFDPQGPSGGGGKSNMGAIIGGAVGGVVVLIICAVGGYCLVKRRKAKYDKEARDSDAKAAALVADGDDDIRHGRRSLLNKYNNDNHTNSYGNSSVAMSAVDHYAAAAAIAATNGSQSPRGNPRHSDTFSQGNSENDFAGMMPMGSVKGFSENATQQDPNYYYQQLQQQQQQQQQQQYAHQSVYGGVYDPMSPTHSATGASQVFAHSPVSPSQSQANTLEGGYSAPAANYTMPVVIQQGDGAIQGPHPWTGSYYEVHQPAMVAGAPLSAMPPVIYNTSAYQQPWVSNAYYGATATAATTPTTPGFPPSEYSHAWNESNASTAIGGASNIDGNKHHSDGYKATALPARGPQAVSEDAPTDYLSILVFSYLCAFYIQGGIPATAGGTGDLSVLDLTSTWSADSPAWTTLASGNWVWHHAIVPISPEYSAGLGAPSTKGYLLTVAGYPLPNGGFWSAYNIQTGVWTNLTAAPAPYAGLEGHTAVTDPGTGLVYVMGGFYNNNPLPNPRIANLLTVFDPKTARIVSTQTATDANNMTGASAVWSSRRKTIVMFEGSRAVPIGDVSAIVGSQPGGVTDDGSKIFLFGGAVDVNVVLDTIHILDVDSGQWTQGHPAPAPRTQMACAYHNGFFVVFGGTSSKNQTEDLFSSQVIIYDVNKDQWVDRFSPPDATRSAGPSTPSGDGTNAPTEDKSNMKLIVGIGVGGIVLLMVCACIGGLLVRNRRRDRKAIERDARAAEMLSDGEDRHGSSRRRTMYRKVHGTMATTQVESDINSGEDGRANSWTSETFSKVPVSESDSTIPLTVVNPPRISDTAKSVVPEPVPPSGVTIDPKAYYLHLLSQQQILQSQHPELMLDSIKTAAAVEPNVKPISRQHPQGDIGYGREQSRALVRNPQSSPGDRDGSESTPASPTFSMTTANSEKAMLLDNRGMPSSPIPTRRAPHTVFVDTSDNIKIPVEK